MNFSERLFFNSKKNKLLIVLIFIFLFTYFLQSYLLTSSSYDSSYRKDIVRKLQTEIEITLSNKNFMHILSENVFLKWVVVFFSFIILSIFLIGIFLSIIFLFKKNKLNFFVTQNLNLYKFKFTDVFNVALIGIILWQAIFIFKSIFSTLPGEFLKDIVSSLIFSTFLQITILFSLLIYLKKLNLSYRSVGLTIKNFYKNVVIGVCSYIRIFPITIGTLMLSSFLLRYFNFEFSPNVLFTVFVLPFDNLKLIYLFLFITIFGPICEEIFFRGFLYRTFRCKFNVKISILISSIIFSFLHLEPAGFLPIFILSVALAFVYEKTGSIVAPIVMHVLHNSLVLSFMLILRQFVIA